MFTVKLFLDRQSTPASLHSAQSVHIQELGNDDGIKTFEITFVEVGSTHKTCVLVASAERVKEMSDPDMWYNGFSIENSAGKRSESGHPS